MIDETKFYESLKSEGIEFFAGVPDSHLNEFCLFLSKNVSEDHHVIAANEGNAVALAAGYHLATAGIPLVYMQNSGLGNATNPLLSLTNAEVYAIPMVLLIGWRGEPGSNDWAQHRKQGALTPRLLEAMDIPYRVLRDDGAQSSDSVKWAVAEARSRSTPVALLAGKNVLAKPKKPLGQSERTSLELSREDAIESILNALPGDTLYVATTGRATRELFGLREKHGISHDRDFLNVGAMGHASQIATGLALAKKERCVACLDGDGAAIMHLGALATTGVFAPSNLFHFVLNNGAHESVGGEPTAGFRIDLTGIACNCGYNTLGQAVNTAESIGNAIRDLLAIDDGPRFLEIHIRQGLRKGLPPLEVSHLASKQFFMRSLNGFAESHPAI